MIRFRCGKLLLLFAPVALLAGLSLLVNPESWRGAPLWICLVLGGAGLLPRFGCLVLPRCHFLHLTPEGLVIQYLIGRRNYSWRELRNFRVAAGRA